MNFCYLCTEKMNHLDRQILQLALPSIVSNVTVPLLGLSDVVVMGHVGGAVHIGAIAVGSMIFNVIYWLFGFLRMGTSGLTAQAFGARDLHGAAVMLRRGLLVALAIGVAFVVLQRPLQWLAFLLMRPDAEVASLSISYFYICIWGAPAVLGLYALTGWYVGMQNTYVPMLVAIGQNVANILLSLLLVLVCHLQVRGVAWGTVIAQWLGFLASLWLLRRHFGPLLRSQVVRWGEVLHGLGRFFRLNSDIFLRTVCLVAVNLYFTSAGAAQGALVLAANTLLLQFFMFFSFFMDGFAFAIEALTGRYQGARDGLMLSRSVRHGFMWGGGVTVLFTVVYLAAGGHLLPLLTSDAAVIASARCYLPWVWLIPVCGVGAFVWDGVFIGTTSTRGMLMSCLSGACLFFILFFLLHHRWGNHALWLSFLAYLSVRGVVLWGLWRYRRKEVV